MHKKLDKICKNLMPTKLTTIPIPYNWLAFLAVNGGYTPSCVLIRICY